MKKHKNTWVKRRHYVNIKVLYKGIARHFLLPNYIKTEKPFDFEGPAIILCNHVTGGDQFMMQNSFKRNIYFVGTEDLFSLGLISKILNRLFKPISKTKSVADLLCVKNCLQVVKEGGLVSIFPEGNRTYSGELCYIDPAIIKLIRKANCRIILCNIVKGYSYQPRWADDKRKTKDCRFVIRKTLLAEEIASLDDDKLYREMLDNLNVNEFETPSYSKSKHRAEFVERMLYICPDCGSISTIESSGETIKCSHCGATYKYDENLQLVPQNSQAKMTSLLDWYHYQEHFIINSDISNFDEFLFHDENVELKRVIQNKRRFKVMSGSIKMNNSFLIFENENRSDSFNLDDIIAFTCCGKNKLNFYTNSKEIYQVKGDKRFNPLKYMHLYYKQLHVKEEKPYDEFLGL